MILNIGGGGGLPIRLIVTAPTGSAVSVTQGTTVLAANEVDGVWTFAIPSLGVWTIHATIEGQSLTQDVDISKVGQYNVTLEAPIKATLNDNDWATIKEVADESKGANYWAVGDTKQITINGKLSDGLTLNNYQTWVYIIGFDHNKDVEGTGIAFCGFKSAQTGGGDICLTDSGYYSSKTSGQWFNINNLESNAGGWASCLMRTATIPAFRNTLPADLLSVIKTTNIYTDNVGGGGNLPSSVTATQDDIYLLAEWEIGGMRSDANSAEQNYQKQYAYYAAGNSRIRGNQGSASNRTDWWERSPYGTQTLTWCIVGNTGTLTGVSTKFCGGFAPAFKVGGVKYTPLEYIQSTGTQYIDTGIRVTPENYQQLKMSVTCEKIGKGSGASDWFVDGSNIANAYFYMGVYNGKYYYGCGTADHNTGITATSGKQTFTLDIPSSKFTVSDTVDVSISTEPVTASASLYLFGFNYNPVRCYAEKVYSCQIYMGDMLVRDFIAAKDEVGNAGLYDKVEGKFYYNAGTGVFGIPGARKIDSVSVGQSVYCNVNDTKTEFIIVHQGKPGSMYDDSCSGTWLLMKNIYENRQWNSSNGNNYKASTIHSYLNSTFLNLLDIKDIIRQAKIPYVDGTGGSAVASGENGLSCKVFLMSGYEVGWTTSDSAYFPVDGAKLDYFAASLGGNSKRIANFNGTAANWWLRSPFTLGTNGVWCVNSDGDGGSSSPDISNGIRPAFIIPSDTYIDENNNILTAPPYNTIGTLNAGDIVNIKVSGSDTDFIVVQQGNPNASIYDASCDGTWLMAKNYTENVQWNSSNKSDYSTSTIYSYLNDSWLNKVDASVAKIIKQVKIPYCKWDGTSLSTLTGGNGLSSRVFLLSGREIGWTANVSSYIPDDGVKLQYFDSDMTTSAVSKRSDMIQRWLRSPHKGYMTMALYVKSNGDWGAPYCTDHNATNPTFIVPSNTFIDDNHNIVV